CEARRIGVAGRRLVAAIGGETFVAGVGANDSGTRAARCRTAVPGGRGGGQTAAQSSVARGVAPVVIAAVTGRTADDPEHRGCGKHADRRCNKSHRSNSFVGVPTATGLRSTRYANPHRSYQGLFQSTVYVRHKR